jgi:hypothetical protein
MPHNQDVERKENKWRSRRSRPRPGTPGPPKLLDRVRAKLRLLHYVIRTEEAYVDWARQFILFHNKRHPREMGAAEVDRRRSLARRSAPVSCSWTVSAAPNGDCHQPLITQGAGAGWAATPRTDGAPVRKGLGRGIIEGDSDPGWVPKSHDG